MAAIDDVEFGIRKHVGHVPADGGAAHRVVAPEHRQGTRTDVRQLVGGQGEVGLVAPEPQTPIGDGEVGVFEVAEPLPREQLAAMLVRALALPPSR